MKPNHTCAITGCGETLSERSFSDICPRCRSVSKYWRNPERGLAAILVRQQKLRLWQSRMIYLGKVDKDYAKAKRTISNSLSNSTGS